MFQTRWDEKVACEFYERGYWTKRTFFDILSDKVRLHPAREVFEDAYRAVTYAELKSEVERCAEVFRRHGIDKATHTGQRSRTRNESIGP